MSNIITPDTLHEDMPESPTTAHLRANIMAALEREFPGASFLYNDEAMTKRSAWILDIKDFKSGGVLTLRNLWISGRMGVTIKLKNTHKEIVRDVIYYASELFERYNIARSQGFDMREDLMGIPRNFNGEALQQ